MATYTTDAAILQACANRLWVDVNRLVRDAPQWPNIVAEKNADAYTVIRSKLMERGFSAAQIDSWDQREVFNRNIAVCMSIRAAMSVYQDITRDKYYEACSYIDALETVFVAAQDEAVNASNPVVSFGPMRNCTDKFTEDMW
jgi:hypothetical protein